jgi:hypothetical protein
MKISFMIVSVTSLKEEIAPLMGIIPSKIVNRHDRRGNLLEMRKPTVACRLNLSLIFWIAPHFLRLASYHYPIPRGLKPKEEEEMLL